MLKLSGIVKEAQSSESWLVPCHPLSHLEMRGRAR